MTGSSPALRPRPSCCREGEIIAGSGMQLSRAANRDGVLRIGIIAMDVSKGTVSFLKERTVGGNLPALKLTPENLARIAAKIKRCTFAPDAEKWDTNFLIEVKRGDIDETFSTSDPAFFVSEIMPSIVRSVHISGSKQDPLTSASVVFDCESGGPSRLRVTEASKEQYVLRR